MKDVIRLHDMDERAAARARFFGNPAYPEHPVQPMREWRVRLVVEGTAWGDAWKHEATVWAYSSSDAVARARADFYGTWASQADRERLPVRVVELHQLAV